MQRILDLGCGTGDSWQSLGSKVENWTVVGVDVDSERVVLANQRYADRSWRYLCGRGESLPLKDRSVDGVICRGALPYMSIPTVLAELHRVLVPEGWLRMSLHPVWFAWTELKRSFPRPQASMYRVFVILNGMYLHTTGRVMRIGPRAESCQTEKGIQTALQRAGFIEVTFRHPDKRFVVEARKSEEHRERKSVAT